MDAIKKPDDLDMDKEYLLWSHKAIGVLVSPKAVWNVDRHNWFFLFKTGGSESYASLGNIKENN